MDNINMPVNFNDAESGLKYFNAECKAKVTEPVCVATILVRFAAFKSIAVRDALMAFVKKLFVGLEPFYEGTAQETRMYFYDRTASESDRVNALLDKCVTLNTYFKHYFYPNGDVVGYCIFFGIHGDEDKLTSLSFFNFYDAGDDYLDINEVVKLNSKAADKVKRARSIGTDKAGYPVYDYNVVDPELARALDRKLGKLVTSD